jgi:hypothetical protein
MLLAILIGLVISIVIRKGRLDFNAVLAFIMALWAEFGAALWNGVGENNYSGLPSFFQADSSQDSIAREAFLAISLALSITSLLTSLRQKNTPKSVVTRELLSPKFFSIVSLISLVIWLIGNGPSIFGTRAYLSSDGLQFVYQATNIAFPLIGFYCLIASARASSVSNSKLSSFALSFAQGVLWLVFCLAAGSRTSVFIVLGLCFITYQRFKHGLKSGRIRSGLVLALTIFVGLYLSFAVFSVTFKARTRLFGLRDILSGDVLSLISISPSFSDWTFQLQGMLSSVFSAFPITEMSSQLNDRWQDVLLALNPLPSGFLGYSTSSSDLILPWLPVSTIGQIVAAFGSLGVVVLYSSLFMLIHFCFTQLMSRGFPLEATALRAFSVVVLLVSLQYPIRMTSRLMSFIILLSLILLLTKRAARKSKNSLAPVVQVPQRGYVD